MLTATAGTSDPVADALHIDPVDLELSKVEGGPWCAGIRVRKLGASRHLAFTIAADGHMSEVKRCG